MQQPMTAIQTAVPASQLSVGTALVVFTQFFGGGIFIALGQTIFTNSLGPALKTFAPSVDKQFVINVGATSLRGAVPASELKGVLMAYNQALTHTFVGVLIFYVVKLGFLGANWCLVPLCWGGSWSVHCELGNGLGQGE
jgi:hypothetical protein